MVGSYLVDGSAAWIAAAPLLHLTYSAIAVVGLVGGVSSFRVCRGDSRPDIDIAGCAGRDRLCVEV